MENLPPVGVILAAAGLGRRLGARAPKGLIEVAGSPLFLHPLRTLAALKFVHQIAVVLPRGSIARVARRHGKELRRLGVTALVPGGRRRQDSVREGLRMISTPVVLVHDAARPLVEPAAVKAVARAAALHGAAVLASPAVDTIKIVDRRGRVVSTPPRARVWHAQTPQGFRREVLEAAYKAAGSEDATDDAELVERAGRCVVVVPSPGANFKVTTRGDLDRAGIMLDKGSSRTILAPVSRWNCR